MCAAAVIALTCAGCGLALDYDPPDPQPGSMDAATSDGGTGEIDAAAPDAGPPVDCTSDADCDDGDACDGVETCDDEAHVCKPGEPIACPDDDVCDGVDHCVAGECVAATPIACPMDDDPCNGVERCDPVLGCTRSRPIDCDDGVDCTVDLCTPDGTCDHVPSDVACDAAPGGRCEADGCQYDTCDSTTCVSTGCVDATCADERTCVRTSLCDFAPFCCAGTCVLPGCDDGNPCTEDGCDAVLGCVHRPLTGDACDDGDRCTTGDRCSAEGRCVPGPPRDCSDGDPCTSDRCDPMVGCTRTSAPDGTVCNDGNACSLGDRCEGGRCVAGPLTLDCTVLNDCLVGRCDRLLGCSADPRPPGTACGLGARGTCDGAGHCCGGGAFDCDGDGVCECGRACDGSGGCPAPSSSCRSDGDCGLRDRACCLPGTGARDGYCYDERCLGCCMVISP